MSEIRIMKRGKVCQYRFEIVSRGGVRRYINKSGFEPRKEAQEAGAIANNEYFRTGRKQKIKDMSYEDYLDYWMTNYCYFKFKYATIASYLNIIKNHLKPELGMYKLTQLDSYTIQNYINKLYKEKHYSKHHFNSNISLNNISIERNNANLKLFSNQFYNPNPNNCSLDGYYCQSRYNNKTNEKTYIKLFSNVNLNSGNNNINCGSGSEQFVIKNAKSISVGNNLPTKINYVKGIDKLDLTGGKLVLAYTDGTSELIDMADPNVIVSNFDSSKLGTSTVTISYFGLTTTFDVNVIANTINNPDTGNNSILIIILSLSIIGIISFVVINRIKSTKVFI